MHVLSNREQQQINELCRPLISIGYKHFLMSIVFNNGSTIIVSNAFHSCYDTTEGKTNGYLSTHELMEASAKQHKNIIKANNVQPAGTLIRPYTECVLTFSALSTNNSQNNFCLNEEGLKKFEAFCMQFFEKILDILIRCNPDYRFSFIFTSKSI